MFLEPGPQPTDEEVEARRLARRFAAEVLRPASLELDRLADPSAVIAPGSPFWEAMRQAYSVGLHAARFPQALGGAGLSAAAHQAVTEELAWGAVDLAIAISVASFPFAYAALGGDPQLMTELVQPFVGDEEARHIGCWAITEPDHGSDTLMFEGEHYRDPSVFWSVVARPDGDEWVIEGSKSAWVSNGTIATHALVFLGIEREQGMAGGGVAVVPLDRPGVSKGPPLDKLGQRALNQGQIFFDRVRIPRWFMLVGPEGYPAMIERVLAAANTGMATLFSGLARAAFEEALDYARQRVQGGRPIARHQLVQWKLFDMFVKVETARTFARTVALSSASRGRSPAHALAAKVYCTQAAFEVASDAVQIFGGMGLVKGMLVEKLFRDARAALIEDGTNEVLGLTAIRRLMAEHGPAD
ncbi:Acyl-CoA dehydrogenase [bacterium HR24]|nr:Acyl-CoA dehydrogenase [bacterium HR24]